MHRRLVLPTVVLLAAGGLTACGGGATTDPGPAGVAEEFIAAAAAGDVETACSLWTDGQGATLETNPEGLDRCTDDVTYAKAWWAQAGTLPAAEKAEASSTEEGSPSIVTFDDLGQSAGDPAPLEVQVFDVDGELRIFSASFPVPPGS